MTASAKVLDVQTYTFEAISGGEEDVEIHLDAPADTSIKQAAPDVPSLSAVAAKKRPAVIGMFW